MHRAAGPAARRLLVIVGLCLLLGGVVVHFSVTYSENLERKSARHYRDVERVRAQLQQLSVRLLEVQEDERLRLSRELHDEIGQALTALRIEISYALPETGTGEAVKGGVKASHQGGAGRRPLCPSGAR